MEHTPGPWEDGNNNSDAIIVKERPADGWHESGAYEQSSLKYYGGYLIAESVRPCDRPLIKAAPDLLAACEKMLAAWDGYELTAALDASIRGDVDDAIAKAKGEQP